MAGKRKRSRPGPGPGYVGAFGGDQKLQRISGNLTSNASVVKQALLAQYYPQVISLRQYLLSKLPTSSKTRRKKILTLGRTPDVGGDGNGTDDCKLGEFMDSTLIGVLKTEEASPGERLQQWTSFSQLADTSNSTLSNSSGTGVVCQSEVHVSIHPFPSRIPLLTSDTFADHNLQIVDFAIYMLFSKAHKSNGKVNHLLCQGFRKNATSRSVHRDENATSAIPGIISTYPNIHVTSIKASPWPEILALLGKEGERVMIDLILNCGIFLRLASGRGSYHQLSGQSTTHSLPLP
jgi:telomerase reverse transcriptase